MAVRSLEAFLSFPHGWVQGPWNGLPIGATQLLSGRAFGKLEDHTLGTLCLAQLLSETLGLGLLSGVDAPGS